METGDRVRVETQFLTINNDFSENVWYFLAQGVNSIADDQAIIAIRDALQTLYTTHLAPITHGDLNGHQCVFYKALSGQTEFLPIGALPWTLPYPTNSEPLPLNAAGLVRFTVANGRRDAGKYLPGLTEATQNMSRFNSTAIARMAAWGLAVADGLNTAVGNFLPILTDIDAGWDGFTGAVTVRELVRSQRRRIPGVGQ